MFVMSKKESLREENVTLFLRDVDMVLQRTSCCRGVRNFVPCESFYFPRRKVGSIENMGGCKKVVCFCCY